MMRRRHRGSSRGRSLLGGPRAPLAASWAALVVVAVALASAVVAAPLLGRHAPDQSPLPPRSPDDPIVVEGFLAPESMRFDPGQGIWFVGNWNGQPNALDDNGMISRVRADGTLDSLEFIAGGRNGVTLHAPRGMTIVGDTLWVADADAIRGFHRRTGQLIAAVDMTRWDPGFLNDIAADDSGTLYVTDTGRDRIYRVAGLEATLALEDKALDSPNGITWHAEERRFVIVPFGGSRTLLSWSPGTTPEEWRTLPSGGRYDGVEILSDGRVLLASQADSSIYVLAADPTVDADSVHYRIRLQGAPADIGVDEPGGRLGVPYVARDLVELWPIGGL